MNRIPCYFHRYTLLALGLLLSIGSLARGDQKRRIVVDEFGQSATLDYPGKVKNAEELIADAEREAKDLKNDKDNLFDEYGGLIGSREKYGLTKAGYFRVQDIQGRKILVTPAGNIFFHLAVCTLASVDDYTTVKGREGIYQKIPPPDGEFATAWRPGDPGVYSFYLGNIIRKTGRSYDRDRWLETTVKRLRSWGFNSAGAFTATSPTFDRMSFPYVRHLEVEGGPGIKQIPDKIGAATVIDPFTPGIEEALDAKFALTVAPHASDPLTIGYLLGNEQHFETLPKLIPTYKGSKVAAKKKLVEILQEKYRTVAAFNSAWKPVKSFQSFSEVAEEPLQVRSAEAAADMQEFFELFMETYYSIVERSFRRQDPNHLLLGSRWTPGTASNETVVRAGGRHLDVMSLNYYTYAIEKDFLSRIHEWGGGKPIILSEWHYASMEHGLGGSMEVKTERDRGLGYRNYVEQAASLPFVVGTQWFSYLDQSITGRFFEGFGGEGNNIGLVNVVDRPYRELVNAAAETNFRIYDVVLGKEKPFAFDDARFTGKEGARKVVAAPVAPNGLRLDGTTTGWPGRPATAIPPSRVTIGTLNPELRGDFRLCWDEENLYFHIQVKDPTPLLNTATPERFWLGDAVELFIGWERPDQGGTPLFSDRHILVSAAESPSAYVIDHPEKGARCSVVTAEDVSSKGYVMVVTVPFSILGFAPAAGMELLFDVAIDNSNHGASRREQLIWNGTAKNSSDRGAWGRAKLVEN